MRLSREVDSIWSDEWRRYRESGEIGVPTPTPAMCGRAALRLAPICRSLGLPEDAHETWESRGQPVELVWSPVANARFDLGTWDFGHEIGLISHVFSCRIEYRCFPEAMGDPRWIKPDWRLSYDEIFKVLQDFRAAGLDHPRFRELFSVDGDEDWAEEVFGDCEACLFVMAETMQYVLDRPNPREFLLNWSA